MLNLTVVRMLADMLGWFSTLGRSDLVGVKENVRELIGHLSASIVSLWDAAKEITRLKEGQFTKGSFIELQESKVSSRRCV